MKARFSTRPAVAAFAAAVLGFFLFGSNCATAQRLPETVRPEHYTLALTPDLSLATFAGNETIDVTVKQATSTVTLNAAELSFQSVTVTVNGKEQIGSVSLDSQKEQATLTFPNELAPGKAKISIQFSGKLNNELRGFYLSKTARRNYAVTQFEPTDARRAFPSFDEPAFKATFDVTLVIDTGDTAISNGPIVSDTPGPVAGKHILHFATTPKMSTYLVAFLVGDFQCSKGEQDGVAIRVCSTPDKVTLTPYGVDVAKYVLHYYNDYFGIHYPLKKLDLIALPDFEAGAMENFGAITYRETDLLIDSKTASSGARKEVALVIAHEMAHQWFGDLVTMQWWNNLWLNEGFATWMENKAVAAMHPEWNLDQTVAVSLDNTLNIDAQPTTRAIRATADTPDEINQMFDGISYGKASDVLLTVENFVGPKLFRDGVRAYIAAHLYGNATAEDFWDAQKKASQQPVDKIMESLVAQTGEPILTFGTPINGTVHVEQKRFYLSPSIHPDLAQKWTLPVCFKVGADGQRCQLLTPEDSSLPAPKSGLFFANAGDKGYYRTAYAPKIYSALLADAETKLTPAERIGLIGDEWVQVRSNNAKVGDYLDLVGAIRNDSNAQVISAAMSGIGAVYDRIARTPAEKAALTTWIHATFAPQYAHLRVPSPADSVDKRELRAQLFATLGYYGKDPAIFTEARQIADKYLADPASVDAMLGETALAVAARNGDAALFDRLQKIYETSANPELQETALRLLAEFENPALLDRALNYATSEKVRNQDAAAVFSVALANDATRDQTWKFIETHWDKVQAQLTTAMGGYLVSASSSFCTEAGREDVKAFFSTHKVPASDAALRHALERIDGCIELRNLQEPSLQAKFGIKAGIKAGK